MPWQYDGVAVMMMFRCLRITGSPSHLFGLGVTGFPAVAMWRR